jgi:hypothetical protein
MAKKHNVERPIKYFGWDTPPEGKYQQPVSLPTSDVGSGYPQKDFDKDNVLVKGRWPSGTGKKTKLTMRGTGAAERGKGFMENHKKFSVEE